MVKLTLTLAQQKIVALLKNNHTVGWCYKPHEGKHWYYSHPKKNVWFKRTVHSRVIENLVALGVLVKKNACSFNPKEPSGYFVISESFQEEERNMADASREFRHPDALGMRVVRDGQHAGYAVAVTDESDNEPFLFLTVRQAEALMDMLDRATRKMVDPPNAPASVLFPMSVVDEDEPESVAVVALETIGDDPVAVVELESIGESS